MGTSSGQLLEGISLIKLKQKMLYKRFSLLFGNQLEDLIPAKASEVTFVSMIARRRLIDHVRKIYRHKKLEPIDDCFDDDALQTKSILDQSTDVKIISEAINQFEEEDKELLSLSIYQGYSHSEISKLMNIPLGTVKTKLRRNLIKLREIFNQEQYSIVSINNV